MIAPSMPVPAPAREPRAVALACALVVVAAVAAAFAGGLHGAFLYDDLDSVVSNASIRDFSSSLSPPAGATVSGRPFLNLTLALNYALGGTSPVGYHALNILIHAAAALILLGLARRTLARPSGGSLAGRQGLLLAAGISVLWALHPIQVESVGYVIQRAESLMGLLYLLTLYCFIRYAEGGRAATAWVSAAFLSCLLGMGTKEAMATAPLVVLLYDRTFLAGSFREALRLRWRAYLFLAACWIPLAVEMVHGGGRSGTVGFDGGISSLDYLRAQMRAVVLYLQVSAWPRHMVGDYGRYIVASGTQVILCAAAVAGVVVWTAVQLVRRPALGFLGAWFLIILAPTSSFIPVSTEIIALHRMYLPLAALAVAAVLALRALVGAGPLLWSLLVVLAAGLGLATERRDRVYEGPAPFWQDVALKAPGNAGAWNNIGLLRAREGDHVSAIEDYRRALSLVPAFATAHANLGRSLLATGHAAEALAEFDEALRYQPKDPEIHHLKGKAFALDHRLGEAVSSLHESIALDGERADTWFDLGSVMEQAGDLPNAAEAYTHSVALNPANVDARLELGNLLAQSSRLPEAIIQYEEAARLQPKAADIHNNLGSLLAESGRLAEARAEFTEAVRLKSDYAEARDNLTRVNLMLAGGSR